MVTVGPCHPASWQEGTGLQPGLKEGREAGGKAGEGLSTRPLSGPHGQGGTVGKQQSRVDS